MTAAITAFAVTVVVLVPLTPLLARLQVVDVPNLRSSHERVTPRGGGLAVLLGTTIGAFLARPLDGDDRTNIVIALALVAALGGLGLVDDLRNLGAGVRLAGQVMAGLVSGVLVLWASGGPGWLALLLPVAVVWVAGFVNAFNFMDGINGISGVSAAVAGAWYAWLGSDLHDPVLLALGLALVGAGIGFLPWNMLAGKVFLGDVGSYGLGCLLALMALWVALEHRSPVAAVAPLALYLADTAATLARRWRRGARLSEAHREHTYQRLVQGGWSHAGTALFVGAVSALCCALARWVPPVPATACIVLLVLAYTVVPERIGTTREGTA